MSSSKSKALKKKAAGSDKLHKVHSSTDYCGKCGKKTSTHVRYESGHREYDHSAAVPCKG